MTKSIKINGDILSKYSEIISDNALQFVKEIHEKFNNLEAIERFPRKTYFFAIFLYNIYI